MPSHTAKNAATENSVVYNAPIKSHKPGDRLKLAPYERIVVQCIACNGIASRTKIEKALQTAGKSAKLLSKKLQALKGKDFIANESASYRLGVVGREAFGDENADFVLADARQDRKNAANAKAATQERMAERYARNEHEAMTTKSGIGTFMHGVLRHVCV